MRISMVILLPLLWPAFTLAQSLNADSLRALVYQLPDSREKADIYKDLAFVYHNENPDLALSYIDTLLDLARRIDYPKREYSAYYMKSATLKIKGEYQQALEYAQTAADYFHQTGNYQNETACYDLMGSIYMDLGLPEKAIAQYLPSLKICEANNDTLGSAIICSNLGRLFFNTEDPVTSRKYLLRAAEAFESLGYYDYLANTYNTLSTTESDPDDRLPYLEKALQYAQQSNATYYLIGIYNNFSSYHTLKKNNRKALDYMLKSLRLAEEVGDTWSIAESCIHLGYNYLNIGMQDSASLYLEKGVALAKDNDQLQLQQQAHFDLYRLFKSRQETQQALAQLELAHSLGDSLYNQQMIEELQANEAKYEFEKKERQITEQQLQIARSRNNRNLIIIAAILLLAIIAGIYQWYLNRNRRKHQAAEFALAQQQAEAERLRELDDMKSQFFNNISHELRTPLTLISGPIEEVLDKNPLTPQVEENLELALQNSKNLLGLVNEIMDLSKLESGKVELRPQSFQIKETLRRILHAFHSFAQMKKIQFDYETDLPKFLWVQTDLEKLEKILNNLLSNALKFTPQEGRIRLSANMDQDQLLIQVADNGKGIDPAALPRIFDRFYQAHELDDTLQGGTGIGLALSRELARVMGGELSAESELNQGSTFSLRLPVTIVDAVTASAGAADGPLDSTTEAYAPILLNGERPRLLIVEDNPEMSRFLSRILEDHYECHSAPNGMAALQRLQKEHFDLVTSDIMMPQMDGFTLREKVNQLPKLRNLPFIFITARILDEDKLHGLRLGVDDYITKPFNARELKARVHNLLTNQQARADYSSESNEINVTLDTTDRQLLKATERKIIENFENPQFKVQDLARNLGYSERQLRRVIRSLTGLSPVAFILELKLQRARQLLEHRQCASVAEVRYSVGIESASYFTKKFTERFGKSPGTYLVKV